MGIITLILLLGSCGKDETEYHPGLKTSLPDSSGLNFLIISFDALRADALGLYGYHRDTSPNLDRFAKQALVFDNAYIVGCTLEFREELYDLLADPGKKNDLILDQPGQAGRLLAAVESITVSDPCKTISNACQGRIPEELLSPEQIEKLKSLGYIQ